MKSFHRILLSLGIAAMASPVVRADSPAMNVVMGFSDPVLVNISADTKIRFIDNNAKMQISDNSGVVKEFALSDIDCIRFSLYSDVDDVISDIDGITFVCKNGIVEISGDDEIEYLVADTSGKIITSGKSRQNVIIDMTNRMPGIYIIRANNKSVKFTNL